MKKFILGLLLLISMTLLSSCMSGGSMFININNDTKKADTRMENILEAIKDEDKDAIKQMFSKQAFNEIEDFDAKIDCLFDIVQGEPESWKSVGDPVKYEKNDYGHKTKKLCAWYDVETDKGAYVIMFWDRTVDTDNPDNVGLFILNAVTAEDKDSIWESPIIGSYGAEDEKAE